jgi:hypothetical protein
MTREPNAKKDIKAWLDEIGAWHFAPMSFGYGTSGIPDRCGVFKGRGFAIEIKTEGKKPRAVQKLQLDLCEKAGGLAIVAWSVEDVQKAFREAGLT